MGQQVDKDVSKIWKFSVIQARRTGKEVLLRQSIWLTMALELPKNPRFDVAGALA